MTVVMEGMRLVRASERVAMLLEPLRTTVRMSASARDLAPELAPELDALDTRIQEALGHVESAMAVLKAKVDVL